MLKEFDCLGVGDEQGQGSESCGTDGKAFSHSSGGVSDSIQTIRDLADAGGKMGHLRDTAGVVRDGTVGVDRNGNACCREHADGCKRDAVEAAGEVGADNADTDQNDRNCSGLHAYRDTAYDSGRGTCFGLLRDLSDEAIVTGGIDLGNNADDQADDESENDGKSFPEGVEEIPAHCKRADDHDDGGGIAACLQCFVRVGILIALDEEASQNGGRDAQ